MFERPFSADEDPQYAANVLEPLHRGEGVACFVVCDEDGEPTVLYCSHSLDEEAEALAVDDCGEIRAAQAVAIQREAREQAVRAGFRPLVA